MSRKFISTILIAAVTATGISLAAAPARAGNDDLAKVLLGVTALAIVGAAITNGKASGSTTTRHDHSYGHGHATRGAVPHGHSIGVHTKALPASCLRRHTALGNRQISLVGLSCTHNKYRFSHNLPRSCQTRVHTRHGIRSGYDLYCLRRSGYHLASY